MANTTEQVNKNANKAAASKEEMTIKAQRTKSDDAMKKPSDEKAKASAQQAANKSEAGKEASVKTQQTKSDAAKKKPAAEKVKSADKKSAGKAAK